MDLSFFIAQVQSLEQSAEHAKLCMLRHESLEGKYHEERATFWREQWAADMKALRNLQLTQGV